MKTKWKWMCILFTAVAIVALVRLYQWDFREVKLSYVGSVKVEPPLINILSSEVADSIKRENGVWGFSASVDNLKRHNEEWLSSFNIKQKILINWETIKLEELKKGEAYYACIGCKIESMRYFYHSKYTNELDDESKYAVHAISLEPIIEQSVITIYRGDVQAANIGMGFPCD
jgi:hypothetical protein